MYVDSLKKDLLQAEQLRAKDAEEHCRKEARLQSALASSVEVSNVGFCVQNLAVRYSNGYGSIRLLVLALLSDGEGVDRFSSAKLS